MDNKTCGECKHYGDASFKDPCAWVHATFDACFEFEPMTEPMLTNGNVILKGGDKALAEISIYEDTMPDGTTVYRSTLIEEKYWLTRDCAISYVECLLNAPAESEG